MDLIIAAARTKARLQDADNLPAHHPYYGKDHIGWMLSEIIQERVTGEKAHRWLGWAQCAICMGGATTLPVFKNINHTS